MYIQAVKRSAGQPKSNLKFATKARLKSIDLNLTTARTTQKYILMIDRNGVGGNMRFERTSNSPTTLDAQMIGRNLHQHCSLFSVDSPLQFKRRMLARFF